MPWWATYLLVKHMNTLSSQVFSIAFMLYVTAFVMVGYLSAL